MKISTLIFLGLLFSTIMLNAQTDFRPGYVINLNGDTLFGKIDYRGDLLMSVVCKYQDTDNTVHEYKPNDITAFRFIDSKYYVSKEINGTNFFLEFLIKGEVSIYYMRSDNGDHYYLEKEDVGLTEIPYEEGYKYIDKKEYFFRTKKHIGVLYSYMQDAPQIKSKIENLKKPDHKYLIDLAVEYHNAVCESEECIIYEKKLPFLKVNYELIGGMVKFQNTDYNNDKNYSQVGVLAHLWMPRANEKLYFRTGLLYSNLEKNNVKKGIYKIPIQVEYVYPKGIIRPVLAYGMNIYSQIGHSVAFMGGMNIKIYKPVHIGIYYDIDFHSNENIQFLPKKILSQYVSTSIIIKL